MAHPKGLLIERLKKQGAAAPEFRTANTGPNHEPTFLTDVVVEGEVYGTGQGSTKREAERLAAEEALGYLERNPLELEAVAGKSGSKEQAKSSQPRSQAKSKPESKQESKQKSQKGDGKPERSAAKSASPSAQPAPAASPSEDEDEAERFEGPWPVFESLLAGIVEVAGDRVDEDLKGEEARLAIRDFTLELYKDLLEDLGDVVEDDE